MTFPPTGNEPQAQGDPMAPAPEPSPLDQTMGSAPETVNLLKSVSDEDQKKYAEDVCRRTEIDLKSSAEFRKRRTSIVRLYLGQMPPPADDQMNYAQVHYAIVAVA